MSRKSTISAVTTVIAFIALASGSSQQTTRNRGPAWSPDGTKIAFVSNRDGNVEVYVMGADGSQETNLSNNSAVDAAAAWSTVASRPA